MHGTWGTLLPSRAGFVDQGIAQPVGPRGVRGGAWGGAPGAFRALEGFQCRLAAAVSGDSRTGPKGGLWERQLQAPQSPGLPTPG